MDRRARLDTAEALDVLTQGATGELHRDLVGWAVYQIDPTMATVVACPSCRHVALVPSVPKVPRLTWTCTGCDKTQWLEPPAVVWVAGSRPELSRLT
jgi:hypothetical protein